MPSASTYISASPKLGVVYHYTDTYSSYFQYATGFRAPPYDNANFGFTNTASFYQILPNANLKPETANSFEVGFRGTAARSPDGDGGGGLGLAIVRGLIEAHDGTVTVANVDGGCRATVRLPEAALAPSAVPAQPLPDLTGSRDLRRT